MSKQHTTCVMEKMTADGKIGPSEINQMKTATKQMPDNSNILRPTYAAAIKSCR